MAETALPGQPEDSVRELLNETRLLNFTNVTRPERFINLSYVFIASHIQCVHWSTSFNDTGFN